MKKLVRNNVFEVNSSSCHSVSVSDKEQVFDTLIPDQYGEIVINGGQYGRFFERTNDTIKKASYALTSTLYGLDIDTLEEIIREQTLCDNIVFNISEDYDSPYYSYIDHESVHTCPKTKEDLRTFIFDKNSWLFIAHDEGIPEIGFYDVLPKYNKDGTVVRPNYKYKFIISELNYSIKLVDFPDIKSIVETLDVRFVKDSKGNIVLDESYSWLGSKVYYEIDYILEDFNYKGFIPLINKKSYFKYSNVENWNEKKELIYKFLMENLDNEDVCYKLNYGIKKI